MTRINGPGSSPAPRNTALDTEPKSPRTTTSQANVARTQSRNTDGFTSNSAQGASAITAKASGAGDLPAEIPTGTQDYYRKRYDDFVRRNPGQTPPDYYLNYGDKYCQKFSSLGPKDLSPEGLKWRDRTLKNLQDAIEKKRAEDPAGFAQLERNPEAFKAFAYGTHADAYVNAGLFKLPAQDLIKISTTPEFKDLLTKDGLKQIGQVLSKMGPSDLANVGVATAKQTVQDIENEVGKLTKHLPSIPLPHIELPHIQLPPLPFGL